MKLLDEKGLTTVWAAIKNTFPTKSDADGKYAEKSKALGSINFDYTACGLNMSAYNVDGDGCGYINIISATSKTAGVMSASDKAKLDGIATGANNYTLPIASKNTLGGIKSTTQEFSENFDWPIYVAQDGKAFTYIPGLYVNVNGSIKDIKVNNQSKKTSAIYNSEGIIRQTSNGYTTIGLPAEGGTLALTSDISSILFDHAMNGSILHIGYGGMHQVDLLEESGRYDVSDWFNNGEKGSILDIYCLITVNDARIFVNDGVQLILNGKEYNLISVTNKHIRLINCDDYILVAEYNTNETAG